MGAPGAGLASSVCWGVSVEQRDASTCLPYWHRMLPPNISSWARVTNEQCTLIKCRLHQVAPHWMHLMMYFRGLGALWVALDTQGLVLGVFHLSIQCYYDCGTDLLYDCWDLTREIQRRTCDRNPWGLSGLHWTIGQHQVCIEELA